LHWDIKELLQIVHGTCYRIYLRCHVNNIFPINNITLRKCCCCRTKSCIIVDMPRVLKAPKREFVMR